VQQDFDKLWPEDVEWRPLADARGLLKQIVRGSRPFPVRDEFAPQLERCAVRVEPLTPRRWAGC
jgi:hypothetical protein